jgi:hypothetical protein
MDRDFLRGNAARLGVKENRVIIPISLALGPHLYLLVFSEPTRGRLGKEFSLENPGLHEAGAAEGCAAKAE